MKKLVVMVIFLAAWAMPLFAQKIAPEHSSEYYYENVSLEKVYPSSLGYILQYRSGVNGMATMYIPNEWFTDAAGKAELITLPPGKNWPSVTLFFHKGEFSHVRLYVHASKAHSTWGSVPLTANAQISENFKNVDALKIEYE